MIGYDYTTSGAVAQRTRAVYGVVLGAIHTHASRVVSNYAFQFGYAMTDAHSSPCPPRHADHGEPFLSR